MLQTLETKKTRMLYPGLKGRQQAAFPIQQFKRRLSLSADGCKRTCIPNIYLELRTPEDRILNYPMFVSMLVSDTARELSGILVKGFSHSNYRPCEHEILYLYPISLLFAPLLISSFFLFLLYTKVLHLYMNPTVILAKAPEGRRLNLPRSKTPATRH